MKLANFMLYAKNYSCYFLKYCSYIDFDGKKIICLLKEQNHEAQTNYLAKCPQLE